MLELLYGYVTGNVTGEWSNCASPRPVLPKGSLSPLGLTPVEVTLYRSAAQPLTRTDLKMPTMEGEVHMDGRRGSQGVKAILTDVQFWVPAGVLLGGVLLLVFLH